MVNHHFVAARLGIRLSMTIGMILFGDGWEVTELPMYHNLATQRSANTNITARVFSYMLLVLVLEPHLILSPLLLIFLASQH